MGSPVQLDESLDSFTVELDEIGRDDGQSRPHDKKVQLLTTCMALALRGCKNKRKMVAETRDHWRVAGANVWLEYVFGCHGCTTTRCDSALGGFL